MAASLISAGLKKGDRVLIGCSLSPSSALVYLGAIYAGLVAVPVEERAVTDFNAALLEATGAKAVWTETGLREAGAQRPCPELCKGTWPRNGANDRASRGLRRLGSGCVDGHFRLHWRSSLCHGQSWKPYRQHRSHYPQPGIGERRKSDAGSPVSYCFGASVMHSHLYQGGGVVFDRRFMFPDKVLQAITQFGCTTFAGVPTVYNVLLRRSNIRRIAVPCFEAFSSSRGSVGSERIGEMRSIFST